MSLLLSIRQWKPRHLLAAWSAYWAGLVLVTLGPAILAILRVTVPSGGKGSVSAGFSDGVGSLVVTSGGTTVWSGGAHVIAIACAIALPPLALWVGWIMNRAPGVLEPARQGLLPPERAQRATLGSHPPVTVNRSDATQGANPTNPRRRD